MEAVDRKSEGGDGELGVGHVQRVWVGEASVPSVSGS